MGNWGAVFWCLLKCGQRRRPVAFLAVAPNSPKWKKKCKCKLKFDPKIQKCKYLFHNTVCVLLSYIWIATSHPYSRWHKCPKWHKCLRWHNCPWWHNFCNRWHKCKLALTPKCVNRHNPGDPVLPIPGLEMFIVVLEFLECPPGPRAHIKFYSFRRSLVTMHYTIHFNDIIDRSENSPSVSIKNEIQKVSKVSWLSYIIYDST